jgi:hypothetical protein
MKAYVYRVKEKCTSKPTDDESTPQYKKKTPYERRPSAAWFPIYGLLMVK